MPAGMVRPRASQVPPLGAGALAEYVESGWRRNEGGGVDAGQQVGPCSKCRTPAVLYGPHGRPVCPDCDPHPETRPRLADITPAERAASGICACGHHEHLHELYRPANRPAYRRQCRTGGPAGACRCTLYTPTGQESTTR